MNRAERCFNVVMAFAWLFLSVYALLNPNMDYRRPYIVATFYISVLKILDILLPDRGRKPRRNKCSK